MSALSLIERISAYLEYQQEVFGAMQPHELVVPKPKEAGQPTEELSFVHPAAVAKTLEELEAICATSEDLLTDLPDARLVFGVGNPKSPLVLVGEAPGETEDRLGEPFVGDAGQLLNKMLGAIQIDRSAIYICNVGKRRPKGNRTPTAEECKRWFPYLKRQLELINPKFILCLGKVAAQTLLRRGDAVGNMRGIFHDCDFLPAKILVTYHPSALLRDEKYKRPAWEDLKLLKQRLDAAGIILN